MAKFTYVVQDNEGIHARPAGMLAKEAKALEGVKVTIAGNGKTADATRLMAIMAMGIKKGMEVEVTVEGENEEAAAAIWKSSSKQTCKRKSYIYSFNF